MLPLIKIGLIMAKLNQSLKLTRRDGKVIDVICKINNP